MKYITTIDNNEDFIIFATTFEEHRKLADSMRKHSRNMTGINGIHYIYFTFDRLDNLYKRLIMTDNHNLFVDKISITEKDIFDRYTGRVMFPIHNISGKVIGFGGRILITDKKQAKYINSPQTDIYDKSKTLYGLFQAKKAIIQDDNCYLVEGYTDVTSMHQSGIENVVASSGTSLTVEQIKLIFSCH